LLQQSRRDQISSQGKESGGHGSKKFIGENANLNGKVFDITSDAVHQYS
jgi:hypothetical protein